MASRLYAAELTAASVLPPIGGYLDLPQVSLEKAVEPIANIIPNIFFHVKFAKDEKSNPHEGLTPDESACIYLYTMENIALYKILNGTIQDQQRQKLKPWFLFLKLFHSAVIKLPVRKQRVWRGINKDVTKNQPYEFSKGRILTWWRITSCTRNIKVAEGFMQEHGQNTLLSIDCESGRYIDKHSSYTNEEELILLPGTRLQVVGDPFEMNGLHIIHLQELERYEETGSLPSIIASKMVLKKPVHIKSTDYQHLFPNDSATSHSKPTLAENSSSLPFLPKITANSSIVLPSNLHDLADSESSTSTIKFPNGDTYHGSVINGLKNGEGAYKWTSGDEYHGGWKDDKFHEQGTRTWPSGDTYTGLWVCGKKHGRGKHTWRNGNRYEGDWKEDQITGRGTFMWPDGTKYAGNFVAGQRHGSGFQTWLSGDTYTGQWVSGKRHGQGKHTHGQMEINTKVIGKTTKELAKDFGCQKMVQGTGQGDFVNGIKDGNGIFTWSDGSIYNGQTANGRTETCMARVLTKLLVETFTTETGWMIKCMEKAFEP